MASQRTIHRILRTGDRHHRPRPTRACGLALLTSFVLLASAAACGDDNNNNTPPQPCTNGVDQDGDGYGVGCPMGPDCDDDATGITGACQDTGCPEGFVFVPAGTFQMGCNSGDYDGLCTGTGLGPAHLVVLDAFCMQKTEVTVRQFRACVKAGVCTQAPDPAYPDFPENHLYCNWSDEPGSREGHPVNCLSYNAARHFCQAWLGGELPTEAQWEYAARGPDSYLYPWGDSPPPDCSRANCSEELETMGCAHVTDGSSPATSEVGSAPAGASPFGVLDMSGNVSELVRDCEQPYQTCPGGCVNPYTPCPEQIQSHIWRGGAFGDYVPYSAFRLGAIERSGNVDDQGDGLRYDGVGFRCVWTDVAQGR